MYFILCRVFFFLSPSYPIFIFSKEKPTLGSIIFFFLFLLTLLNSLDSTTHRVNYPNFVHCLAKTNAKNEAIDIEIDCDWSQMRLANFWCHVCVSKRNGPSLEKKWGEEPKKAKFQSPDRWISPNSLTPNSPNPKSYHQLSISNVYVYLPFTPTSTFWSVMLISFCLIN